MRTNPDTLEKAERKYFRDVASRRRIEEMTAKILIRQQLIELRKKRGLTQKQLAARRFTRLFMEPGVRHCGGGPGPNDADFLSALEDWVENGNAPQSIVATHYNDETGDPDRTRPLCPYPKTAVYNGSGDINDAANFHCSSGD